MTSFHLQFVFLFFYRDNLLMIFYRFLLQIVTFFDQNGVAFDFFPEVPYVIDFAEAQTKQTEEEDSKYERQMKRDLKLKKGKKPHYRISKSPNLG